MKKYFADILTFTRFILATILLTMAVISNNADIGCGFLLFVFAELTDAFDGTCAMRWPFSKNKTPWYRKYAAKYDMLADALTAIAVAAFFTFKVNFLAGAIITIFYIVFSFIIEIIIYGRLFGHPDDFSKKSLMARNFNLAKKIILARRAVYIILIGVIATWLLYASSWLISVKIIITIIAVVIAIFLWFFLSQRRHNISRDATAIEKKLSKK